MPETLINSDNSKQQYCKYIAAVLQMLLKKKANNKSPGSEKVEGCGGGVFDQHHKPLRIHRLAVFLRRSAAGVLTVNRNHGLYRNPILYNGYNMTLLLYVYLRAYSC